jgi:hypothetical protein
VLREAIAKTGKTALARFVISQRERTIAMRPTGDGLIAHTLYEERDLNSAKDLFEGLSGIKIDPEMVQLASQLVQRQSGQYDAADLEDRYETRLRAMIDAKVGHPEPAQPASAGPDKDCVVDKIQEFADELANPDTDPEEQVLALKFLLHFVGDIHQPLHASNNHDRGGNEKKVSAAGQPSGNLHHYWDDVFVEQLGPNAKSIASDLIGHISEDQVRQWSQGTASDWAMESFKVAKDDAYGQLPDANSKHVYRLSEDYMATATQDVALQLSKGGVRLAFVLNQTLGPRSR